MKNIYNNTRRIIILLIILLLFSLKSNAQSSLGIGYGYTSSGDSPATIALQINKIGGYISYTNDEEPITSDTPETKWHEEMTLGVSYEVFSDYPKINILTGAGWNKTTNWYSSNTYPYKLCSYNEKGFSYEAGFNIQIYKILYITTIMNNYNGLKTMIVFKYTFK